VGARKSSSSSGSTLDPQNPRNSSSGSNTQRRATGALSGLKQIPFDFSFDRPSFWSEGDNDGFF
jgi:hypothetical protein